MTREEAGLGQEEGELHREEERVLMTLLIRWAIYMILIFLAY